MNYNERVKLTVEKTVPGYLGDDVIEKESVIVPCSKASLSSNEQMGIFGKYNQNAFKLHLQGIHKVFSILEYEGVERNMYSVKWHRNSTVVIVT